MLLWRLLFAHFLADFILQSDDMVMRKSKMRNLLLHSLIYGIGSIICCIDILTWNLVVGIVFLVLTHIAVDYWKAVITEHYKKANWFLFLVDQVVHIFFIILVVTWISQGLEYMEITIWPGFGKIFSFRWLSLVIVNLFGGMYFTQQVISSFVPQSKDPEFKTFTSPSAFIGVMERLLIMVAVLINRYEIIGYLFAAKSIIRYPEVSKESNFSNYYLVGTLSSFCWAIVCSILLK
ncbi:MAG TPA: DUF3307 domain-containing protein [Candidatus Cloacimonadota bacterium]|nr:DUF3307 domain-containing protein [Candidatus Cloacimonadota bacterium]